MRGMRDVNEHLSWNNKARLLSTNSREAICVKVVDVIKKPSCVMLL